MRLRNTKYVVKLWMIALGSRNGTQVRQVCTLVAAHLVLKHEGNVVRLLHRHVLGQHDLQLHLHSMHTFASASR